jgi:hypothetical protein
LSHVAGKADGSFAIRIIDPNAIRNHEYRIHGVDSIDAAGTRGITLINSTTGQTLLAKHPLPDTLGHNMPVTEGFKIFRGTIPDQTAVGMGGWEIPAGVRVWTWAGGSDGLVFEGFNGAMGWQEPYAFFSANSKTLKPVDLKNTLIEFAETDTSGNVLDLNDPDWSYGYRYLRAATSPAARPEFVPFIKNRTAGYAYQDYTKSVPFSAWDMESNPPRRLMVGYLENNMIGGMVDGRYWPPNFSTANNTASNGPREWFFIFEVTYIETPDSRMAKDILNNSMPVLWWGTPARHGNTSFHADDEFLIKATHTITSQDVWVFNPTILVGIDATSHQPYTFELAQNYPNPFNRATELSQQSPSTQIAFSIPADEKVTLKLYNMLGQEVATLVDQRLAAGKHLLVWDGTNRQRRPLASGVYFYRLTAGELQVTKKLLLLR